MINKKFVAVGLSFMLALTLSFSANAANEESTSDMTQRLTLFGGIMNQAEDGEVIHSQFKMGSAQEDVMSEVKSCEDDYCTSEDGHIFYFGYGKVNEIRYENSLLNRVTLSEAKETLGSKEYEVHTGNDEITLYVKLTKYILACSFSKANEQLTSYNIMEQR